MKSSSSAPRFVALQHRDFRLLWIGQVISVIGSQMQTTAINWHIYELLKNSSYAITLFGHTIGIDARALGLGTLGLVRVIPILFFALVGGVVADTRDRRKVLLWTQSAAALFAAILAAITLTGHENILAIYALTAAGAAAASFDGPARQSLVPNLVPREHLTNAISLNTLLRQIASITGPALAGLVLGLFNAGIVYAINAVSFVAVIVELLLMHYRGRVTVVNASIGMGWRAVVEGLRFTYGSSIIWSTMLIDFFATFFSSASTMLPIVAGSILKVGATGYGLLASAESVGALIAGLVLSLRRDIRRQGIILLASVGIYGLATALFGMSTVFAVSFILLGLVGAGDTVSTVIRGTVRQLMTPDHLRGRMTSVNMIFFMGGPQLGELEAGLVAAVFSVPVAIITGGVATVLLTAWVAWKYPPLRNYVSGAQAEPAAA
jgi:MFS family permease